MDKSVAQTILEIQKPLSQGEQNFVALHGVLQPNKDLVPGITDQDHIFNGTPRKMDPKTASYENVKDKDDSDESTKVYDKTLKVEEEVESVEEAKGEDEYNARYGAGGKKRPEPKEAETEEGGAGRHKVNYVHPDKKNIGNDRFETKEKAVSYANSLKKKGYHEVSVTEETEAVEEAKGEDEYYKRYGAGGKKRPEPKEAEKSKGEKDHDDYIAWRKTNLNDKETTEKIVTKEAKGEDEYNARYGAGGKKRPPLDPVGKEDEDVNNDNKVDKADSYLSNRRKVVAKYLDKTPVVKEERSSLRLSKTMKLGSHEAKVYRDTETGEHQVKFYTDGKHHSKADYFTDDKEDAHGTAKAGLKNLHTKDQTNNMKENIDQIDELSKNTLGSYAAKAHKKGDMAARMSNGGQKKDMAAYANKRYKGVQTAIKKMSEEIEEIDELKKSTYQAAADEAKRRKDNADAELDSGSKSKTLKKFSASYGKTMELAKKKMQKMDEKTLTPAEMKKREEIAMAIAKKTPNMPMAKKMAIATAAAKKVAENVENLEEKEFSKDSLKNAMDALAKTDAAVKSERTDMARKAVHMQRKSFLEKHINYIKQRMSAEPAMAKEDIDDITEEEININFHRAEAKRVSQKISSLKNSEKPIPDGLFAELQKHKQEIEKAEKNAKFQNEEVDFPTPAADSREEKTRVQRNKEGVLKVIKYKLPRKEIKIGEAIDNENMMQASIDKLKTDPLVSNVKIKLPPSQGVKAIGGDEQVHASMAEEKLNKLYETLSDENKEKFMVKLETESGVQQLIQFAEKQGF